MHIGLALYPGCLPSGLLAFADLIQMANLRAGKQVFEISWVAEKIGPIALEAIRGGKTLEMIINAERKLNDNTLDAVLLPGLWAASPENLIAEVGTKKTLIEMLRGLNHSVAIYSYCSSVCISAAAGKLGNGQATSTWWIARYLAETYPGVDWIFNRACIDNGHNITAAGINGYLPIAIALIETHCGAVVAREITKLMLLPRPEAEQMPFHAVDPLVLKDQLMRRIVAIVEATPASNLHLGRFAGKLNMSERTLARRISAATGRTSKQFIRLVKLNQASEMLIFTKNAVDDISEKLGYCDESTFRRAFKAVTGHTPGSYRQLYSRANNHCN